MIVFVDRLAGIIKLCFLKFSFVQPISFILACNTLNPIIFSVIQYKKLPELPRRSPPYQSATKSQSMAWSPTRISQLPMLSRIFSQVSVCLLFTTVGQNGGYRNFFYLRCFRRQIQIFEFEANMQEMDETGWICCIKIMRPQSGRYIWCWWREILRDLIVVHDLNFSSKTAGKTGTGHAEEENLWKSAQVCY